MNFIIGLPLDADYIEIYTCVDKLTKLVKIITCVVGDGYLSSLDTEKNRSLNILKSTLGGASLIGTLGSQNFFGQHSLIR